MFNPVTSGFETLTTHTALVGSRV